MFKSNCNYQNNECHFCIYLCCNAQWITHFVFMATMTYGQVIIFGTATAPCGLLVLYTLLLYPMDNSFYGITYFSYVQQKSWFPSFNNGPTSVSFWLHFSSFQLTFTEIHNSLLGTRQVDWLTRPTYNTTNKVHRLDTPISQMKAALLLLVVKTTGIQSQ